MSLWMSLCVVWVKLGMFCFNCCECSEERLFLSVSLKYVCVKIYPGKKYRTFVSENMLWVLPSGPRACVALKLLSNISVIIWCKYLIHNIENYSSIKIHLIIKLFTNSYCQSAIYQFWKVFSQRHSFIRIYDNLFP